MKFLKNKIKLTFFIISLVINLSFGVLTAEANNYQNHNRLNANQNKVYLGYGYIGTQDPHNSAIYSKCGIEAFLENRYKLTLEHGSAPIYLTGNNSSSADYTALGLEYHDQAFIAEIKISHSYDISSRYDSSSRISHPILKTFNNIQAKIGHKYNIEDGLYITPKAAIELATAKKHSSYTDYSDSNLFITPEITIGTNFEIPNTIINLNPEVYLNHRFDLSNSDKNASVLGTSINFDVNMFFVKLEHQTNLLSKASDSNNNTSFTFGVKF
jgi:hypothetical protein